MTPRALFTAGALVGAGVMLSRVLGLLREILLASRFGVGPEADMAIALLLIPDFITGALVGTAVSATFVPLFTARSREAAMYLFWQALVVSIGIFALLAILISLDAAEAVRMVTKENSLVPGAVGAFLIAISTIPLTAATAILIAYLQYRGHFRVPAFANAIFNGVIVVILWLMPVGLALLAVSIFCGVLVRLLAHMLAFYLSEDRIAAPQWQPWQLDRSIMKTYVTTMATDICNLMPQFAPYYLIALGGAGLAVFNYAFKLSLMPAMIGYNMTQMVLLPWFSRLFRDRQGNDVAYSVTLQSAWGLCMAVCLSLTMASHEVAQLCFGYGKMDKADIDQISHLFALGVWSMPPMLLTAIWQQILYAHGQPRMPFFASAIQALVIMPLCWIGNNVYGMEGIMLAYASLQVISAALLSYSGYKHGIISVYQPSAAYVRMTSVSVLVWCVLALLYRSMLLNPLAKILLAMVIGVIVLSAAMWFCMPVRQWLKKKLYD